RCRRLGQLGLPIHHGCNSGVAGAPATHADDSQITAGTV
ncbi:uncharacterized protein METZ01_LOCUS172834, partial [marine metagenome]